MGVKRKIFLSWMAIELGTLAIALPAFATFTDRVSFTVKQIAIVERLAPSAGQQNFLVASNAPFAVISEGAVTDLSVTITRAGNINGKIFGAQAQMPGPSSACNMPTTRTASRIYTARDKTAASRGSHAEQSVLVSVTYDPAASPVIDIKTMESLSGQSVYLALPCDSTNS